MLAFRNNEVRGAFHLLPLEKQKEFIAMGEHFDRKGLAVIILFVDHFGDSSLEVSIRIDKKLHLNSVKGD